MTDRDRSTSYGETVEVGDPEVQAEIRADRTAYAAGGLFTLRARLRGLDRRQVVERYEHLIQGIDPRRPRTARQESQDFHAAEAANEAEQDRRR